MAITIMIWYQRCSVCDTDRVDKRGKEINESSKEDLKRYYNLEEDEERGEEEEREETIMEGEQEGIGLDNSINSNDDSNSDQDDDDSDGSSTDLDYDALLPNDNEVCLLISTVYVYIIVSVVVRLSTIGAIKPVKRNGHMTLVSDWLCVT